MLVKQQSYQWSQLATEIIVTGIKNGATPKVILRNMRDKGCFLSASEPSMIQLYNKISNLKKVLNLTENLCNTHDLRQKIDPHLDVPDDETTAYVPYANIDDSDETEETRICVIFATKKTLSLLSQSKNLHLDATYRLNWNGFPVMVIGVTSPIGKFHASFSVLSSHEDSDAWSEIYSFVHSLGVHPKNRMADGATSITKAGREVFDSCVECKEATRNMCWSHVHRNLTPQMKTIKSLDKNVGIQLLSDIEDIQWMSNKETFQDMVAMLESKYLNLKPGNSQLVTAIETFFSYFKKVWVESEECFWYEGANPLTIRELRAKIVK